MQLSPLLAELEQYPFARLDEWRAEARAAGVEVIDHVEESEYGRFGWAVDPEGNRLELWQPAPGK